MKSIAIIGILGLPAKYGGFEIFVEKITQKLDYRYQFTVYCSSREYPNKLKN
jgi:hypothetical protein